MSWGESKKLKTLTKYLRTYNISEVIFLGFYTETYFIGQVVRHVNQFIPNVKLKRNRILNIILALTLK